MTLNGVLVLILLYFTEFVTVVEDRPILSAEYCLRGISAIAELLVLILIPKACCLVADDGGVSMVWCKHGFQ